MVTIKDVAREAGVSVATVSRVWNDSGFVADDTRQHVSEVATRLGYAPHSAARSLITARTLAIGVLLPDLYGEFFSEVLRGIDQTSQAAGYHILVSSSHDEPGAITATLRTMRGRVDGVIVMSPDLRAQSVIRTLSDRFPVVLLNCALEGSSFDSIALDNFTGARAMVRHLVGHGHRRIAIITGSAHNYDAAERRRGWRTALDASGIAPEPGWEIPGDFSDHSGYDAIARLLELRPRPTAVFACNDAMAIGALSALRERGIRVPGQIAVAGFDDIPMARYMNPPLSTVHVDIAALGVRAARRLLAVVEHKDRHRPRHFVLPVELVIRSSCGCRAASNHAAR